MLIDYFADLCFGSTDGVHRFWLVLHGGTRVCINCRARRDERDL